MIDYGVDGIMTDYPVQLKELCEKKTLNGSKLRNFLLKH